jgi:type IV pilus assembly protein PilX
MKTMYRHNKQQGAALIVGLVLLVVITVLAISGMNTATTELAMARNDQNYENAFQAAETGLRQFLRWARSILPARRPSRRMLITTTRSSHR